MSIVVGADVGGTFTDLVLYDEDARTCRIAKVLSTVENQSRGMLNGLALLNVPLANVDAIVHGTTVATNALLERKGARVGLIATKGFRDIAELHTRERPFLYGLKGSFEPLVPRDLRFEVIERVDTNGHILQPLDVEELRCVARKLKQLSVQGVVVTFLNCFANPENERAARRVLEEFFDPETIGLSSEVLPTLGEFERTSTTIINAYVRPLVGGYLAALETRLTEAGYRDRVLVVQSNGGIVGSRIASTTSVNTVLSGPAAGVIAGSQIAKAAGFERCITCDMGGTSFDVSLVEGGLPTMANKKQLGFGLTVALSMIDIATIGAGGGSIAHVDARGFLAVGPHSTGAMPGPACYGRGGTHATVTDANLLLGRLNPMLKPGTDAELTLDLARARAALEDLGARLGLDAVRTAEAILAIANQKMAGSIRLVSVERGYDPRDFILVVFGGAGPLHATALMRELGTSKALIPFYPGLGCALGCIMADLKHEFSTFLDRRADDISPEDIAAIVDEHARRGRDLVVADGARVEEVVIIREADMAYEGQLNSVRVNLPSGPLDAEATTDAFRREYRKLFRRVLDPLPVRIVNLRTSVVGIRPRIDLRHLPASGRRTGPQQSELRKVYFDGVHRDTPIHRRSAVSEGATLHGPAIVESEDTTVLIDPGVIATVDACGNLLLEDRR